MRRHFFRIVEGIGDDHEVGSVLVRFGKEVRDFLDGQLILPSPPVFTTSLPSRQCCQHRLEGGGIGLLAPVIRPSRA